MLRFCNTSTWISHRYSYLPFFLNLPPTPLVVTEPWFEFPKLHSEVPLAIYFTYGGIYIYISMLLRVILTSLFLKLFIHLFTYLFDCIRP